MAACRQLPQFDETPSSCCNAQRLPAPDRAASRICRSVIALQMQTYMSFNAFCYLYSLSRK